MSDCRFLKGHLVDFIERKLDPESMRRLTQHIESCSDCRRLAERFASVWESADYAQEIAPSPVFWAAMQDRLDSVDEQRGKKQVLARLLPILQPSAALAALLVAVLLGYSFGRIPAGSSAAESSDIADLWDDFGLESFDHYPDGSLADIYFEIADDGGDES